MAESVKQICLIAHIITGKNVPKYLKQAKFNALLKKKDKKKAKKDKKSKKMNKEMAALDTQLQTKTISADEYVLKKAQIERKYSADL